MIRVKISQPGIPTYIGEFENKNDLESFRLFHSILGDRTSVNNIELVRGIKVIDLLKNSEL